MGFQAHAPQMVSSSSVNLSGKPELKRVLCLPFLKVHARPEGGHAFFKRARFKPKTQQPAD